MPLAFRQLLSLIQVGLPVVFKAKKLPLPIVKRRHSFFIINMINLQIRKQKFLMYWRIQQMLVSLEQYLPKSQTEERNFYWEDNMELISRFNERKVGPPLLLPAPKAFGWKMFSISSL